MILPLRNTVQPYAWGSSTAIPELFGLENPSGEPMAEIWMGAHPKAPSQVVTPAGVVSLDRLIADDPTATLGAEAARRFGGRLPFLFKILSAGAPLSIQAHPSLEQARAGFAAEEASGLPRDAANRNYRDDNHKPELIYALTSFWGMRGFRSPDDIADGIVEYCGAVPDALALPAGDDDLSAFFASLMQLPEADRERLIAGAVETAHEVWPELSAEPEPGDPDAAAYWILHLAQAYPGDPGVLSPLFLALFSLRPGEATYLPAGVLHAYLRGTGAELMANSDNVLRGGLTPKHIDLKELLRVGVFQTEPSRILTGEPRVTSGVACPELEFPTPFEEFLFSTMAVQTDCELAGGRPRIVFCAEGSVTISESAATAGVSLRKGQSAFVGACEPIVRVAGQGTLLVATTG